MIKRRNISRENKKRIVLELLSKQSPMTRIARREPISVATISNWRDEFNTGAFRSEHRTEIGLRKGI